MRRKFLKLSQKDLAQALDVSYQQIQKYEKGDNRVSASALHGIAQVLDVPIAYFFEGAPQAGRSRRAAETRSTYEADPMSKSDVIRMAREFDRIADVRVRRRMIDVAKSVADSQNADE
jgi:transcriptional regulator with XRE-family HTH domain